MFKTPTDCRRFNSHRPTHQNSASAVRIKHYSSNWLACEFSTRSIIVYFTQGEPNVEIGDLYASLWQVGHHCQSLPHDDVWVVSPGEGLLKTRQLLVGERSATSTLLAMSAVARLKDYICTALSTATARHVRIYTVP